LAFTRTHQRQAALSGSIIGAMSPTQLILDDCRQQNFTADMEITPIKKINEAPDQLFK
jgi:uncharacterized zinc-type alcohol dehydrogenase-like protein